jgi:hypothetical protein
MSKELEPTVDPEVASLEEFKYDVLNTLGRQTCSTQAASADRAC